METPMAGEAVQGTVSCNGFEREMLDLMPGENSWEQILYQVVAMKDLDPWSMDVCALSKGFSEYIATLSDVDFRVPAKWVMISAVLVRMQSDNIRILKMDRGPQDDFMGLDELDALGGGAEDFIGSPQLSRDDIMPMQAAQRRMPVRRITITELVDSLRRVLATGERREEDIKNRMGRVNISTEDIAARIEGLYRRITGMLGKMDEGEEIRFSQLVGKWERGNVIDHFMPLIHLDNDKKVSCTQKEMFSEIFIKGGKGA
jgi:chromatin segregation and condensation protein Rec8/ScpA/Scc1 (kleisin family)